MALTKQTLTLISIFALLFSTLYAKETSSPTPDSSPKPAAPSPTATPAASPSTLSHLFSLLPSIGVKKALVATPGKGANVASKQLQGMEPKMVAFRATIKSRLADPTLQEPAKKCFTQCDENLGDAIDNARIGIQSINKADLAKANFDITAVSTDVDTCHDCFKEANTADPEIKSFDEWVQGVTGDCLKNLKS